MALSDEEKATLEALQRKAEEPDDEDFEIEIWDGSGAGAKLPYRKGQSWLSKTFGIDLPVTPPADDPEADAKRKPKGGSQQQPEGHAQRYFGNKKQA